jgi:uncharacterized membrane protein
MALRIWEIVSIVLAALVAGMFVGPWAALSRSIATFEPEVFLAIVRRMDRNMAQVMRVLMPAALLSIVPVLIVSYGRLPKVFWLNAAGFLLLVVALLVTMLVEVPIVKQIVSWTATTLPADWERLRDRWSAFHLVRIGAAMVGLVLLLVAAIF